MASGNDPGQPGGGAGDARAPELTALEQRVGRLELELAALRRQMDGEGAAAARNTAEARISSPAPPPPIPAVDATAAGADQGRRGLLRWTDERAEGAPNSAATSFNAKQAVAGSAAESRDSLESRLGSQIFNRIAIVLLLSGTAYFMKLAVDRGWIVPSPTARVILGLLAGTALVLWSERFRRKGFAAFSYSLKAVGSGVLYLTLWAGFQRFHLFPPALALALMLLVTAWNAYMAWAQDSELLGAYALAGGFATPMLLSTGGNHENFLFLYLLALDVAIVALVRLRGWPRLLLGAFPLTVAFYAGWYMEFYDASALPATAIFIALFGAVFASVPLGKETAVRDEGSAAGGGRIGTLLAEILLPLANASFVGLAFYLILQDSGDHTWLPWLMVVLAAVYLGVMRLPQTAATAAIHLSLAVVFLTIAIPLKASGSWITVSWLVEGLALLWVATRLAAHEETSSAYASRTLRLLAVGSLLLGFCGVCVHLVSLAGEAELSLLNKGTGTAVTAIAVFASAAWLALGRGGSIEAGSTGGSAGVSRWVWDRTAMDAVTLIALTAALLTMRELLSSWTWNSSAAHPPFQTADFFTALIALAVFAGVIAASLRVASERLDGHGGGHGGESFWMRCAVASTIAFNLIAVLTGVREIEAIWEGSSTGIDAGLQQALAISGFLMLYGALLLAAGFWRRSGFLRWQALVLLVFTICKTFLYDMRSLSQGYRVASLLGLGALLMAISFAYQKDWLNLRGGEAKTMPGAGGDRNSQTDAGSGSEAAR